MALIFNHILVWGIERFEINQSDKERISAEMDFLRENGVVLKCGFKMPPLISFKKNDGTVVNPFSAFAENSDIVLPFEAVLASEEKRESESHADRVVRGIASKLQYNDAPVVAHSLSSMLVEEKQGASSIEVILKNVPAPPKNMPWEDFIQFRNEEENIAALRMLRLWVQKRAMSKDSPRLVQEELESMLYDYKKYMSIQHKKYTNQKLSILLSSTPDIFSHVMRLRFGELFKKVFEIKAHKIALTEAEMNAPGREISYFAKVNDFVDK